MSLSLAQRRQVLAAARGLPILSPTERVEDFIGGVLGLNPFQQGQYFPNPDPSGLLAIATGHLSAQRETILRDDCAVPTFVIHDVGNVPHISGLSTYLTSQAYPPKFTGRVSHHQTLRNTLRALQRGHHLESLAAAIMNSHFDTGEATQFSADEGIDVLGWKELLTINRAFTDGGISGSEILPGQRILVLASSKAVIGGGRGRPRLLDVAHIRELIGGWVIQRSPFGKWKEIGIQTLSPLQLVLVTTYRLSLNAKSQCRNLGVQVWSIPELIYLICKFAPDAVFDAANNYAFSATQFRNWWRERDINRRAAA